jgi:hypothetical protein
MALGRLRPTDWNELIRYVIYGWNIKMQMKAARAGLRVL